MGLSVARSAGSDGQLGRSLTLAPMLSLSLFLRFSLCFSVSDAGRPAKPASEGRRPEPGEGPKGPSKPGAFLFLKKKSTEFIRISDFLTEISMIFNNV